ncbi:hypothetical protein CLU79DRAFT_762562 [Phycomyces nitens]|nr:hypothetical protein CLU79DRAFT_762562 [Phycomyces nitens]
MDTSFYEQSPESAPEPSNKSTGRPKKSPKPAKDKNGANMNSKRIKIQRACDACRKRKVSFTFLSFWLQGARLLKIMFGKNIDRQPPLLLPHYYHYYHYHHHQQ